MPMYEYECAACGKFEVRQRISEEPLTGPMPESVRTLVPRVDNSPLHKAHLNAKERMPSVYQGGRTHTDAPEDNLNAAGAREGLAIGAIVCLDCHGGARLEVHRFVATSEDCEQCHEDIRPKDESGQGLDCLDCHAQGFEGRTIIK